MELVIINRSRISYCSKTCALTKRILNILLCILLLPFAIPAMAVIALLIRLDSPGPALFVQDRRLVSDRGEPRMLGCGVWLPRFVLATAGTARLVGGVPQAAGTAHPVLNAVALTVRVPGRGWVEPDDAPPSVPSVDLCLGLVLANAEPTARRDRVVLMGIAQKSERRGLTWELVAWQNPELREAAQRVTC